jgi:hypothetical protein
LSLGDITRSIPFYEAALTPLGITARQDYDGKDGPPGYPDLKDLGANGRMFFWLREGIVEGRAAHVGFSVPTLHALEAINYVLGDFASVAATSAVRRPTVTLAEDGSTLPVTAHDQIAISGVLKSGVIASIFYRGEVSRGNNLRWQINGTKGDLVITAALGNLQIADLKL